MLSTLFTSYCFLALCVKVCGVPINDVSPQLLAAAGNRTTLRSQIADGLTSSSNYRGTLDIVWSCVLTLTACVYTALHLNIPLHMSKRSHLWRKMKWAALALFAPEIVVHTALQQFFEARDLVKQLNEQRFGGKHPEREPKKSHTSENTNFTKPSPVFDLRYGYYVTMGGFTVDVEKLHNKLSRMTLTPSGVITLAKEGHFLDISAETVSDKSKASIITKALICVQVLWMLIQCLARKAVGYPLTLLEIHTMVHVVCALTMFILWWEKPMDINEPTLLDPSNDPEHFEITALMLMTKGRISKLRLRSDDKFDTTEVDALTIQKEPEREPNTELATGNAEPDVNVRPKISWRDGHDETAKDTLRWNLAYQAVSKEKSMQQDFKKKEWIQIKKRFGDGLALHSQTTYAYNMNNASFEFFLALIKNAKMLCLALVLLPAVYGGIHLTAWGFESPSRVESLLWKISCLLVMSSVIILLLSVHRTATFVLNARALILWVLYTAPRIFLVVESFISLRHVPIGVYAAVPWVQNIPHI